MSEKRQVKLLIAIPYLSLDDDDGGDCVSKFLMLLLSSSNCCLHELHMHRENV